MAAPRRLLHERCAACRLCVVWLRGCCDSGVMWSAVSGSVGVGGRPQIAQTVARSSSSRLARKYAVSYRDVLRARLAASSVALHVGQRVGSPGVYRARQLRHCRISGCAVCWRLACPCGRWWQPACLGGMPGWCGGCPWWWLCWCQPQVWLWAWSVCLWVGFRFVCSGCFGVVCVRILFVSVGPPSACFECEGGYEGSCDVLPGAHGGVSWLWHGVGVWSPTVF